MFLFLKVKHLCTQMRSRDEKKRKMRRKTRRAEPDDLPTLRGVLWRKFHQRKNNKWSGVSVCGGMVLNTSCCSEMLKISIGSVNWHLENNEMNLLGVYKRLLAFTSPSICCCVIALRLPISPAHLVSWENVSAAWFLMFEQHEARLLSRFQRERV